MRLGSLESHLEDLNRICDAQIEATHRFGEAARAFAEAARNEPQTSPDTIEQLLTLVGAESD